MISIRPATVADVTEVVELGVRMHAESPRFSRFPYSLEKAVNVAHGVLNNPDGIFFVAQGDTGLVGMFAGGVTEHAFVDGRFAYDLVIFVAPEHRSGSVFLRLLKAFEDRAKALGADECAPGLSSGVNAERTLQLFSRLGYSTAGYLTFKDL